MQHEKQNISQVAARLDEFRAYLGLNKTEFSERLGLNLRNYSSMIGVRGVRPSAEVMEAAVKLGASAHWLLTGEGPMRSGGLLAGEAHEPAYSGPITPIEAHDSGFALIPLYSARAAAGDEKVALSEEPVNLLAFREEWIRGELRRSPLDLFLLTVDGDSMTPTLVPGEVVLIDRTAVRVVADAIYLVRVYDGITVKRCQWQSDGLHLLSDNAAYKERVITRDELDNGVQILGRVIWGGRRY